MAWKKLAIALSFATIADSQVLITTAGATARVKTKTANYLTRSSVNIEINSGRLATQIQCRFLKQEKMTINQTGIELHYVNNIESSNMWPNSICHELTTLSLL